MRRILSHVRRLLVQSGSGPRSILIVANDLIPTVQLSFLQPLRDAQASGDLRMEFWAEKDVRRMSKVHGLSTGLRLIAPDIVVFSRYSGVCAAEIVKACRDMNVAVIYHIDDDLLNVPKSFGEKKYIFHNDPARLSSVRYLLEHSDLVYAANERLARHLQSIARVGSIVSGDVYCASPIIREPSEEATFRIGYMGFDHAEDFAIVTPALASIMTRFPQVVFVMFGPVPVPEALMRFGSRIEFVEPIRNYDTFRQRLADEAWDIGLCPLVPTPFNLLKSDTKWVEYTASGMATVASRGTIYDRCCSDGCGLLIGNFTLEWENALSLLITDNTHRRSMAAKAQSRVQYEYSMDALAQQVFGVFDSARTNCQKRQV